MIFLAESSILFFTNVNLKVRTVTQIQKKYPKSKLASKSNSQNYHRIRIKLEIWKLYFKDRFSCLVKTKSSKLYSKIDLRKWLPRFGLLYNSMFLMLYLERNCSSLSCLQYFFLLCCEAEVSGLPLLVVAKIRNVLQEVGHELNLLIMIR